MFMPSKKIKTIRKSLTHIAEREPLNFLSVFLIIALDIFILASLFDGLDRQVAQVSTPEQVVPLACVSLVESARNVADGEISLFDMVRSAYAPSHTVPLSRTGRQSRGDAVLPACAVLLDRESKLSRNDRFIALMERYNALSAAIEKGVGALGQMRDDYDTVLLEKIAQQERDASILDYDAGGDIAQHVQNVRQEIVTYERLRDSVKAEVESLPAVADLYRSSLHAEESIMAKRSSLAFWYPFKVWLIKFVYLIPLFAIFFWLHRRYAMRGGGVRALVFAHAMLITAIPIFVGIVQLILHIIPRHLLEKFFAMLEALNIAAVFNYFVIFFAITAALAMIYFAQKKLFSAERMHLKRLSAGRCPVCGTGLRKNERFCYRCGTCQERRCEHCGENTAAFATYCTSCGQRHGS